ncbi:Os02g0807600, partial [Oryza sativa Japonica Group]
APSHSGSAAHQPAPIADRARRLLLNSAPPAPPPASPPRKPASLRRCGAATSVRTDNRPLPSSAPAPRGLPSSLPSSVPAPRGLPSDLPAVRGSSPSRRRRRRAVLPTCRLPSARPFPFRGSAH